MTAEEFLNAYAKLKNSVPRLALINSQSENSNYTSYSLRNKNVYICMGCELNEDCYYGYWIYENKDAVDASYLFNTEIAYECIDGRRCYNILYCQDCTDSRDLFLCFDCIACHDCFGCVGLRRKQYHVWNVPYSEQEYKKEIAILRQEWKTKEGREKILSRFHDLKKQIPHVYMHQLSNENCTGDYIYNSRNCLWSFDIHDCQDSQYLYNAFTLKDSSDCSYARDGELFYECLSVFGQNFNFCYVCWGGSNLEFCEFCFNCSDCFGCIGLKNKQFYILNIPFNEKEYRREVASLKRELVEKRWYSGKLPSIFWEG